MKHIEKQIAKARKELRDAEEACTAAWEDMLVEATKESMVLHHNAEARLQKASEEYDKLLTENELHYPACVCPECKSGETSFKMKLPELA